MSNPWLKIPLSDYEGHMAAVQQTSALAELFQRALDYCQPESVAVLGIAGGNGLEHVDRSVTKRIVGIDINQDYLAEVERRFNALPGLELHCRDLTRPNSEMAPVAMVHAALIFEHAGVGAPLDSAISLVNPAGRLCIVLQLPSTEEQAVSLTPYTSIQSLKRNFLLIDSEQLQRDLRSKGFRLLQQERRSLPAGKALWLGVFGRIS